MNFRPLPKLHTCRDPDPGPHNKSFQLKPCFYAKKEKEKECTQQSIPPLSPFANYMVKDCHSDSHCNAKPIAILT